MNEQAQIYAGAAISAVTLATYYSDAVLARFASLQALIDTIRLTISL